MTWSLALLLTVAAQAGPIDERLSACIVDGLSAEGRAAVIALFLGDQGPSPAARQSVSEAAERCSPGIDMASEGARRSTLLAVMRLTRGHLASELAARGFDMRTIDAWFDAQPLDFRTRSQMDDEGGRRIYDGLVAAGLSQAALSEHGRSIGRYYGTRAIIEVLSRGLPVE